MFRFLCSVVLIVCANGFALAQTFSHDIFDRVLRQHVDMKGRVDYTALKADSRDLDAYIALLGKFSPETTPDQFPTRNDSLAYWINAYNAFAISGVVDAYPVKSVKEIKWFYGFFNRTDHYAGGKKYTLKHIEHQIVRKQYHDARIHAALNCASGGCPRLPQKAFRSATLQDDLDHEMRYFLREKRNVLIDRKHKRVYLSHILKEFETDCTDWIAQQLGLQKPSIIDFVMQYVEPADADFLSQNPDIKISYFIYDWTLNDQALHPSSQAKK